MLGLHGVIFDLLQFSKLIFYIFEGFDFILDNVTVCTRQNSEEDPLKLETLIPLFAYWLEYLLA